jgi:hypothetical protein
MKLMNIQAKSKLHQLRNKIALLQLRPTWKPQHKKIKCPFCQSMAVYRQRQPETGNTHGCQSCEQKFSEELLPECTCGTPGRLPKCLDCPLFQSILPLIKEKVSSLQNFTLQQLENLLDELEPGEKETHGRTPSTIDDFYHSDSLFAQFSGQVGYIFNIDKCREAVTFGIPVFNLLDVNEACQMNDLTPVPNENSFKNGRFINEDADKVKDRELAGVLVVEKSASVDSENLPNVKNKRHRKTSNNSSTKSANQKSTNEPIQLSLFD